MMLYQLFDIDKSSISCRIVNIYRDGELSSDTTDNEYKELQ